MELSLLSRGILTRLADPFLRNCPETAGKSLAARRVEHPQRRPPIRKDFQRALPFRIWFLKRWGRFSLACLCVPPEFRRAAQSSISDRKSTRLNSSHQIISYAVFCLKKKKHHCTHVHHHHHATL